MKMTAQSQPFGSETIIEHLEYLEERLGPGWDRVEESCFVWTGEVPDENIQAVIDMLTEKVGLIPTPEQVKDVLETDIDAIHETCTGCGDTAWREIVLNAVVRYLSAYSHWPCNADRPDNPMFEPKKFLGTLFLGAEIKGWKVHPEWKEALDAM